MGSAKAQDPLAQTVEHLTFNQGVRSSSLRWVTKNSKYPFGYLLFFILASHSNSSTLALINVRLKGSDNRRQCAHVEFLESPVGLVHIAL